MAQESNKPIIIKKIKKGGHGGHHGGSWKVAYADFVTAMMAFFLLMWLVAMASPQTKQAVSTYFQNVTILEGTGQPVPGGGGVISILDQASQESTVQAPKDQTVNASYEQALQQARQEMKEELTKQIEEQLKELRDQVVIDTFDEGVRIQMITKEGSPLFNLGVAELTERAKVILKVITDSIKPLPNPIAIEGHTDASVYANARYTNWELSTDRASAARKEMERDGFDPERLKRVAGFAATQPLLKDNPYDARNRRISILVYDAKRLAARNQAAESGRTPATANATASNATQTNATATNASQTAPATPSLPPVGPDGTSSIKQFFPASGGKPGSQVRGSVTQGEPAKP